MAHYDPKTGTLRPTWTVRFGPGATMLGCLIGGVVCVIALMMSLFMAGGTEGLGENSDVARGAILLLGGSLGVFAILGPTLAWGLTFALRSNPNHGVHILAFAVLGLFVGFSLGALAASYVGIVGFGQIAGPAAGTGAAVGRWSVSRFAKV